MEPEDSLLHSQEPATCPYPEPHKSSPCPPSHFLKLHFIIILPSTSGSPKCSCSLGSPYQNPVCASPLPHTKHSARYPDTEFNIPRDTNLQHTQCQQLICKNCSSRNSSVALSLQLWPPDTCRAGEIDVLGLCTTFLVQHDVKMVMITDESSSVHRWYSLKPYKEHDVGQNLSSWYDQRCCFLSLITVLTPVASQACQHTGSSKWPLT
jgi:hypothetical protein